MATSHADQLKLVEGIEPQIFAAIEQRVFPMPWRVSSFVKGPAYRGWSLKLGERTVGFLYVQKVLDEAEIIRIAVLPDCQRRGYAKCLWQAFIEHPDCADLKRISLEVAVGNKPALAFYERLGFRISGMRHDYYGPGEDALTMLR